MNSRVTNLVTGGSGFLGSNLIDNLMSSGEKVICLDNCLSGRKINFKKWENNPRFKFIEHDIVNPITIKFSIDKIWHLACPASRTAYKKDPINTSKINFLGTYNMLNLAKNNNAKILLASSSEIYGQPEVHPQTENYNGSVNCIGERSSYIEGKRIAESLCLDFKRLFKSDVKIARIFNTYGPKMKINDGRVIANFIVRCLRNEPIIIYGEGSQTRSFCYVDDLISGLNLLMNSNYSGPMNIGNPEEIKIYELAKIISSKGGNELKIVYEDLPADDTYKRKPCIKLANNTLGWEPKISLDLGIEKTMDYFKKELRNIPK